MPKTFLSKDDCSTVICTSCEKYLSVPPIIISSDSPVCGRCAKECEYSEKDRAYFYENIAKYMVFPCINDIHGCSMKLPWVEVLDHEAKCTFARIVCPDLNCDCVIKKEEMIDHIKTNHKYFTTNENKVIGSTCLGDSNDLFLWKNHWLILQMKRANEVSLNFFGNVLQIRRSKGTFCRISSFDERITEKVKIILIFRMYESDLVSTKEAKIMNYVLKKPKYLKEEQLNYEAFGGFRISSLYCQLKLEEIMGEQKGFNDKMLSNLECPVCTYHMLPPIYMCNNGHNLCRDCKAKLSECPYCSGDIRNENHFIKQFVELVTYPCKYNDQGCGFTGSAEDITRHEPLCCKSLQDDLTCFTNHIVPCEWEGRYADVYEHIHSLHSNYCVDIKHPVSIGLKDIKSGFVQYGVRIFKINLEMDSERKIFRWAATCITNKEQYYFDDYLCYLNFKNQNATFTISRLCGRSDEAVNDGCFNTIPLDLLQPFIEDNKLTFEINIV